MNESSPTSPAEESTAGEYVVVARRYRPQAFDELIGQEHVARALKGAIESDRVGHAYLFTGSRGVGKTSAARILAKALDCVHGPTAEPCGECDICQSVAQGSDIDVIEIDGASNNGVDEVRALRQNAIVRPSRARYKIYIIDEVHMLSKSAFNALLKTLEEPPEHVKFIFATTEANKIPITILSRCQRYDFAGIEAPAIRQRLAQIAETEGVEVDSDALQIIAMRAAGSMRDSQSLLEQLLSTGSRKITSADVTGLLGLAPAARLSRLVEPLVERNAAAALAELDAAIAEGAEVGQLIDQLLGYFRDVMTQAVGCDENQLLYALPAQRKEIRGVAERIGVQTLLAISQILDQSAARMRVSTQVRTLAEMALVRICNLQDLDEITSLIEQLRSGEPSSTSAPAAKKNGASNGPLPASPAMQPQALPGAGRQQSPGGAQPPSHQQDDGNIETPPPRTRIVLDEQSLEPVWKQTLDRLTGIVADCAAAATRLAVDAQGRLLASFPESQRFSRDQCQRPANLDRIEAALAEVCGGRVGLTLATHPDPEDASAKKAATLKRSSPKQQQLDAAAEPFVQRAVELFDADSSRLKYVAPDEG